MSVTVLLSESEVAAHIEALADQMAPALPQTFVAVCLLTGGIWFSADLTRALSKRGKTIRFESLWLSSYGDDTTSGDLRLIAPMQRPVKEEVVLLMDDVLDTGKSLRYSKAMMQDQGAASVITCVFARKPDPLFEGQVRDFDVDYYAYEAPDRFLVGYGLDHGGYCRELPFIGAKD